jgi:TonB-linked SusC/RagA family outer membrane protein
VSFALLALSLLPPSLRAAPLHGGAARLAPIGRAPAEAGVIRGRVTERESGQPVPGAQVVVVGTRLGALTDATGNYVINGVTAGQVALRITRIGYAPQNQTVSVTDGAETTVNVALERAAARLEEVVTTATGAQSVRQFGNVVATIKTDSITAHQITPSMTEVLQARTAGVQVIQGTGQTGSSASIRIRGTSSLSLTNEPLVIVDGIRFDNAAEDANFTSTRVNRLSTLNPDEVESIDIIKGPSAAALYGTAAANGVVVIKTKRGQIGRPQWSTRLEYGMLSNPGGQTGNYWSYGRNRLANGTLGTTVVQCKIQDFARNLCVVDSTRFHNPWTDPETHPFKTSPRYLYGGQVSGGTESMKYFLSAEREDETGPYHMPAFEQNRIRTERGGISPRQREINPNALVQNAFRGNFSVGIRPNLTLDVNSGYVRRDLWTAFEGTFFAGMTFQFLTARGTKAPIQTANGLQREYLGDIFGVENKLRSDRFTGSAGLNWQPYSWLTGRAVVGIDQNNNFGYRQQLSGEGPRVGVSWGPSGREGGKDYTRVNASRYTTDLGATATYNLLSDLSTRTSIGAQLFFDATYQSQGRGYGLPPGASTPNSASRRESWEFTTEEKTYGAFLEEQVGWRDRLFVTVGGRTDQNSAFGRTVGNTFYPRAAVSYVISEEDWFPHLPALGRLRLRGAFGRAGVQPSSIAALQFLGAAAFPVSSSADEPGLRLQSIGNSKLRPEVTTEYEGGADMGFLNDRLNIEATIFRKISRDALFNAPLPPSYGTALGSAAPTQWKNLARVENRGLELTVDAQILQTRMLAWNVRFNGSKLNNKLVDAGGVTLPTTPGPSNQVGYPLFGLWDRPIVSFSDANGDGIITDAEITVGKTITQCVADHDRQCFKGSTLPLYEAGFGNTIGFFSNRLQFSTLFDYRGKFFKRFQYEEWRCQSSSNCRAVNSQEAPLADQAAAAGALSSSKRTIWGYFVPNDFIKFREASMSYSVPDRFVNRYLRGRATTFVVSGRNLGYLWTKYPGVDPESNNSVANTGGGNSELTAQPPIRYWTARINFAF